MKSIIKKWISKLVTNVVLRDIEACGPIRERILRELKAY